MGIRGSSVTSCIIFFSALIIIWISPLLTGLHICLISHNSWTYVPWKSALDNWDLRFNGATAGDQTALLSPFASSPPQWWLVKASFWSSGNKGALLCRIRLWVSKSGNESKLVTPIKWKQLTTTVTIIQITGHKTHLQIQRHSFQDIVDYTANTFLQKPQKRKETSEFIRARYLMAQGLCASSISETAKVPRTPTLPRSSVLPVSITGQHSTDVLPKVLRTQWC